MSPEYIFFEQDMTNGRMTFKFLLLDLVFKNLFFQTKIDKIQKNRFPYIHMELFENLVKNNTDLEVHFFKENTYSLGLIILSLAIKFDFKALYNNLLPAHQDGQFNQTRPTITRVRPLKTSPGI